jgi:D-3-phosphoglycerate dehydrogenase
MSTKFADHVVLCAGDQFITAASLAQGARHELDEAITTINYQTQWPDGPFRALDRVTEASGDPVQLATVATNATVVLTHLAPITEAVFDALPDLEVVGVTRGGPVNVDLEAATAHGVPVIFLPGRNLGAVAEFVIGVMINLTRNIGVSSRQLADGEWDARYFRYELTGPELRAATVGLIGLGAVGSRVAQLLAGFGSRVVAYDPFANVDDAKGLGVEMLSFEEVLAISDIVSLHARLTASTRKMFDAAAFSAMKPGSCFINTARGQLVNQEALLQALDSGRLSGAALDVFDPEPPERNDLLLSRPDVLLTPHLAGSSRQVATESVSRVVAEVGLFLRTGAVKNCANPQWAQQRR